LNKQPYASKNENSFFNHQLQLINKKSSFSSASKNEKGFINSNSEIINHQRF